MELTIVIAIVGILAVAFIPSYKYFVSKSVVNSCLQEAKNYTNNVLYSLHDQDNEIVSSSPVTHACDTITNAQGWTLQTQDKIVATVSSPANIRIICDVPSGGICKVVY